MKNFLFDTVAIDAEEIQLLEDTYKELKIKFKIGVPDQSEQFINKFEIFNNIPGARLGGTLLINHPSVNCYLNFVKFSYQNSMGGRGGKGGQVTQYDKYQVWAFADLKSDFGRILIRRETFTDKILEIIHPVELKFNDDRVFSNLFYVVANDREKAKAAMTKAFRKILVEMMYKDFVIEIINTVMVIRTIQPVTPDHTISLAEFINKISQLT
ncbi:hypothetical protein [Mucilaginibacter sp. 3215]|uniref:hypothetical protein n=1 Tax=Mucilaginibacter sp. 3215 TaxID=3373912 RepID=UPI003D22EF62